jgi:predicted dehydrogenase
VRWGVLGTGKIGANAVIPAIRASSNGRVVAVASRDLSRARALAAKSGPGVRAYGDYAALLDDADVEAVYIPLPNAQHAEWCLRAAAAGKHILCEKPLALTAAEARGVVEACARAGVLVLEGFMYRFHPQIQWTHEQVAAGRVGEVKVVRSYFGFDIRPRPHDIRLQAALGGGSLMDVGCYPVSFARLIYGREPQAVSAQTVVPQGAEVEHAVAAIQHFGSGQTAVLDCAFQWPRQQRAEVVGTDGKLVLDMPYTPGASDVVVRLLVGDETIERRFPGVDQYRLQMEHFATCVREGTPLATPPEDAVANAAAIEMIYGAAGYRWPR